MTALFPRLVCIGAANIDRKYQIYGALHMATSNPAHVSLGAGGVAFNVALNFARLGGRVALLSRVGVDDAASELRDILHASGVDVSFVETVAGCRTSEYAAIIDVQGELVAGVCDASVIETINAAEIGRLWPQLTRAEWIFADCNLGADALAELIRRASAATAKLAIDGVSEAKVRRLPYDLTGVDLLFVNEGEAESYLGYPGKSALETASALRERGVQAAVLTLGDRGQAVAADQESLLPAALSQCVDVTGAGDALIAGTLYGLIDQDSLMDALRFGSSLAALTIESTATVRKDLTLEGVRTREKPPVVKPRSR